MGAIILMVIVFDFLIRLFEQVINTLNVQIFVYQGYSVNLLDTLFVISLVGIVLSMILRGVRQ